MYLDVLVIFLDVVLNFEDFFLHGFLIGLIHLGGRHALLVEAIQLVEQDQVLLVVFLLLDLGLLDVLLAGLLLLVLVVVAEGPQVVQQLLVLLLLALVLLVVLLGLPIAPLA